MITSIKLQTVSNIVITAVTTPFPTALNVSTAYSSKWSIISFLNDFIEAEPIF
jgi:hypothetical protein